MKKKTDVERRVKKPSVFKLKKKLWTIFSVYIRLRDANDSGIVKCCTCEKEYYWTDSKGRMQAGHFMPQKLNSYLIFDEQNVHGQCSFCNGAGSGEQYLYSLFILKKYGKKVLARIVSDKGRAFKFTHDWLEIKIKEYQQKVAKLKQLKKL